ncbi:DUF4157 domain-containing protein [Streptomyces sp. NA04227]|nr:DUF4157 domain-containing protein [Streptomyces sp. NA04227]
MPVQRMLNLQGAAGNAAVARAVEEERHEHGPGCGHGSVEDTAPAGQRGLLDAAMATESRPLPGAFLARARSFYQNDNLSAGRVHDNPTAQRATEAMGARAMTVGTHIFLGPSAVGDTETLAHEAGHLDKNLRGIRETGNDNGAGVTVTDPGQASERAAQADGAAFVAGAATAPSVVAQRAVTEPAGHEGAAVQRSTDAPGEATVQRAPAAAATEAGPVEITHPQIKLLTPRPGRLYRGDSRPPEQVMGDGGFTSQGTNYDKLIKHLLGRITDNDGSGWISTSSDEEIAKTFASPPSRSELNPGRPASLLPPRREVKPTRVSTGWVYEIKPTGNIVAFDDHAEKETETRQTKWTKEWGAIRKINAANIERAVKYQATYQADKHGAPSNRLSIEAIDTWENPDFDAGDQGYDPYKDPESGWSDDKNIIDRTNVR